MKTQGYFITGTDTGIGKTIATYVLGRSLQKRGIDVGVMKPVQCSGDDAQFLKRKLKISDDIDAINPFYLKEPLSPHLAFQRAKRSLNLNTIKTNYKTLIGCHDIVLVEGAGGLMVPLKKGYLVADLISDMDLELIIVSRLALGTINHTLLTIEQARSKGLKVKGVVFNQTSRSKGTIPEKTNPDAIRDYGSVDILGTIPYLTSLSDKNVFDKVKIDWNKLIKTKKKNRTARLISEDKKYVWHPFTQMKDWEKRDPLVIDQAKGNYLIDSNGKRYFDGVSSLWVNVHGHQKKEIDEALQKQIKRLGHSTLLGLGNTPSIELAKRLVDITPKGLDKVFYSDSGSTAVEIAVKMAYQYWQNIGKTKKKKLVHLANSYHGDTLGSVSVGGIALFHKVYRGLVIKTIQVDFPDCYRAPKGKTYPDYAFECLKKLEVLLKDQHDSIAAFIVEPIVQGAAGMIVWPKGILKRMRELCSQYDVLFIADEVATGFGRTGTMFACEHERVDPDIICLAKGLSGGYLPLAATVTSKRIYDGFKFDYKDQKTFFHGHTYTGNPLCCAAALANLEIFKKEKVLEKLQGRIKQLKKGLQKFYNLNFVGDVRQKGLMVGIELVKDKTAKAPFDWEEQMGVKVCQKVLERGVILRPLGNVIVLMPPLSITRQELDKLLSAVYWAIEEVTENIG